MQILQEFLWNFVVLNPFSVCLPLHSHPSTLELPFPKLSKLPFTLQTASILHYAMFLHWSAAKFSFSDQMPQSKLNLQVPKPLTDVGSEERGGNELHFGITCSNLASSSDGALWDLSVILCGWPIMRVCFWEGDAGTQLEWTTRRFKMGIYYDKEVYIRHTEAETSWTYNLHLPNVFLSFSHPSVLVDRQGLRHCDYVVTESMLSVW